MSTSVFSTMGTTASFRSEHVAGTETVAALERIFDEYDARFSLYRPDSELSKIAAGSLALTEASRELLEAYELAVEWRQKTQGDFTPHRGDGVIDLSGIVKAIAMRSAGRFLLARGISDWSLSVGGDVVVDGAPVDAHRWTVGIVDPADRAVLLTAIAIPAGRRAVATSGSAERGEHIWRSQGRGDRRFAQVSVMAGDMVTADVLATAIVAGGDSALDAATGRWPIDVVAVGEDGEILMSPGMAAAMRDAGEDR